MPYYFKKGTKQKYGVIGDCQIRIDNQWVKGVVYLREGKTYARLKKDFDSKFEEEKN